MMKTIKAIVLIKNVYDNKIYIKSSKNIYVFEMMPKIVRGV